MKAARYALTPPLGSLAAGILWVVLAWRSPTLTHHFAPLVVGLAWGFLQRFADDEVEAETRNVRASSVQAFVGGLTFAVAATLFLVVTDKLQGPGLYGSFPIPAELVLHGLLGAFIGARPWSLALEPS